MGFASSDGERAKRKEGPLSWEEARRLLRESLEAYYNHPPPPVTRDCVPSILDNETTQQRSSLLSKLIHRDVDLYAGALALSVVLLFLATFLLYSSRSKSFFHSGIDTKIYQAEMAGAALLVTGSILGVWVVRRRRFLCLNDSDTAKRRVIRKFLQKLQDSQSAIDEANSSSRQRTNASDSTTTPTSSEPEISNPTTHTSVYPVYRRKGDTATWSRIPSLLLVKGDWVALQIGDIAPAACVVQRDGNVRLQVGDRLTVAHCCPTMEQITIDLPKGRRTLSMDDPSSDDHLLTLCNNMQVFTVDESPIDEFVRHRDIIGKPTQISRKMEEIREALFIVSLLFLILTAAIIFGRLKTTSSQIALVAHIPILAALGALPVIAPTFLFFLEVLATSRILTTVHAFSQFSRPALNEETNTESHPKSRLLLRYIVATSLTRLSLWSLYDSLISLLDCCGMKMSDDKSLHHKSRLVRVPPASLNLVEKLGVATAFTLVDDELACEPASIPQQLLIPSAKGLKLLDLFPAYDSESDEEAGETGSINSRKHRKSFDDSDSESDDGKPTVRQNIRRKVLLRSMLRVKSRLHQSVRSEEETDGTREEHRFDVQFEDPTWWQYLPSLKCIGLTCLLHEEHKKTELRKAEVTRSMNDAQHLPSQLNSSEFVSDSARSSLVKMVCHERRSRQLLSLAECIGFSTDENMYGPKGDISPFIERLRLHVLSNELYRNRLTLDTHERSSEQSRWWGLIRPDSTSVIVQDSRTKAYQLLTVGDPAIVANFCNEAWQGEISTILPLGPADRKTIIDTTNNWKLADLDVAAFSYTPVPHTLETQLTTALGSHSYLLDHADTQVTPILKDKNTSPEWSFVKNQIFLGVLGSLVVPRLSLKRMIHCLTQAGVRFVYFSPRNMRRQKELAIQLGLDVSWNCAISLRPLESGEEDPHRMVSNYADWDVNAKLPHGVEDVRMHLKEVDNVPLLVSLFTDATKATIKDMIEIFQEHNDTVITVGISHLTRNGCIFSRSDVSVGIDVLDSDSSIFDDQSGANVLPEELEFVSAMSAHSCAFRFTGASSIAHIPAIIEKGRASLDAAVASTIFGLTGSLSFSFYVLFTACSPLVVIPFVPTLDSVVFLQLILPIMGFAMSMSDGDINTMKKVPAKNDKALTFGRNEKSTFYSMVIVKALFPALLPQILHLIAFGELLIKLEPAMVAIECPGATHWVDILRCEGLKEYSGPAKTSSGSLVFGQFVLCVLVSSAGFVNRSQGLFEGTPWNRNSIWVVCSFVIIGMLILYVSLVTENGCAIALPWYFYIIAGTTPFISLACVEMCKRPEIKQENRAEKLRRLQFETRLGAWSPR